MNRLIREVKAFFESYEIMNSMFDRKGIRVEIFEANSKNVLQVKIIENPTKGPLKLRALRNMFCDIKVEGNIVKMNFKYRESKFSKEFIEAVKSIRKNDYVIKTLGNQVMITIIDPRPSEISAIFIKLEPFCRKFDDGDKI